MMRAQSCFKDNSLDFAHRWGDMNEVILILITRIQVCLRRWDGKVRDSPKDPSLDTLPLMTDDKIQLASVELG